MIGLIVDGAGDYAALTARYKGRVRVVKSDGPRGHTATEDAIAESSKKQVALLSAFGCTEIAILTDFEGRTCALESFAEKIQRKAIKISNLDVTVIVADQMIENWLLADIAYLSKKKKYLKGVRSQKKYESTNGKSEIKKHFVAGFDYNEVKHSSELFPLIRVEEASKYSASFSYFIRKLGLD
ncbi:DUF4276 family protein [Xanthomonas sp. 4461]|uniref:DUF4276 family protein n=1 Tax=Xanthomonas sp. 4461 TaxID=3035313 RepID=UPI0021678CBE|nr:DUF4276 family protein [Xanthomonas sp. 4461]MCS3809665.1 hypothetical protein [Xanthomonas sp. 4461]